MDHERKSCCLASGFNDHAGFRFKDEKNGRTCRLERCRILSSTGDNSPDYRYLYLAAGGSLARGCTSSLADETLGSIASLKDLRQAPGPNGNTQVVCCPRR